MAITQGTDVYLCSVLPRAQTTRRELQPSLRQAIWNGRCGY